MSYSTILRIRCTLCVRGMSAAVALFRQVNPLASPADFCVFILGKSARVRG